MCRRKNVVAGLVLQVVVLSLLCVYVSSDNDDYPEDMPPPCVRLHVTSNGFQPAYNGFYVLMENSSLHHRPTYRHTVCTFYMYYVDKSPLRFWLLGPIHGGPKGHVMAITDSHTPYMDMDWLTYNGHEGQWAYDDDFEVECIQPETELVAHWPLNSLHQYRDLGSNSHHLTAINMSFTQASGVRLDQTPVSLLYLEGSLDLMNDFTISMWVYPETAGGILQWVNRNSLFTTSVGLTIMYGADGLIRITPGYGRSELVASYSLVSDYWHYLAFTYSSTLNKLTMFVDGHKAWDDEITDLEDHVHQPYLYLGAAVAPSSVNVLVNWMRMGGKMACVRIYKGVVDEDSLMEIMERCEFHTGIEPLINWPLDADALTTDVASHTYNLTFTGALSHTEDGVVLRSQDEYSLYLDTRISPGLTLDGDFSILMWARAETDGGLIQWNNRISTVVFSVGLSMAVISNALYFFTGFVTTADNLFLVKAFEYNTWVHVALTYSKDTSDLQIFVDGERAWQKNYTNIQTEINQRPFISIGDAYYFNVRQKFTGAIACVQIYNMSLERDAIKTELRSCRGRDLAMNPEAFWPLNYNSTTLDLSGHDLHLSEMGSMFYDDGGVQFNDDPIQSLYLDTTSQGSSLSLGGDFSVVFWVKAYHDGVLVQWVDQLGSTVISMGLSLVIDSGRLNIVEGIVTLDNPPLIIDHVLMKRRWYHVALTYHKIVSRARVYIDGEMVWHKIIPDLEESVTKQFLYLGRNFRVYFDVFEGSLACVQIYSTALTEDELINTIHMCKNNLFDDFPVANWPLNDLTTTIDMSGHGFNLTRLGSVVHTPEGMGLNSRNAYEVYLDLTESDLMLNKDFTLLFWVYPETDGGLLQWRNRLGDDDPSVGLSLVVIGNKLNFFTEFANASNLPVPIDAVLGDEKWCHVALAYKRDTNHVTTFIDGNPVWDETIPGIPEAIDKPYLYIGAADVFNTLFRITGKMACFEIFKYYMTEDHVEDVMDSCVSFIAERFPIADWPLNMDFMLMDVSGNGLNLSKTGVAPHTEEGIVFSKENPYVVALPNAQLSLERDFTIMLWLHPETDGGILQWHGGSDLGLSMAILSSQLVIFIGEATLENLPAETGINLIDGRFYHIALTYKKQQSLVQIYIGGTEQWQQIMTGVTEGVSKETLFLGVADTFGNSFDISATMACLRIFNYDMDADDIVEQADKCFVTEKPDDPSRAFWPLNASTTVLDSSGNDLHLTSIGLVDHTDEGVVLNANNIFSLFLDMTSDPKLDLPGDFSVMLWVNYEVDGGLLQWENHLGSVVISVGLSLVILGEKLYIFQDFATAENQPIEVTPALVRGRWYHVALVYHQQSSNVKVYMDSHLLFQSEFPNLNAAVDKPYLTFGSVYIDGFSKFTGKLACVMIYDFAVEAEDIEKKMAMCETIERMRMLQAFWPLNNLTLTMDMTLNQFNLTSTGSVLHTAEGIELDKDDEFALYLDTTEGPSLPLEHDFTVALWVKLEADGGLIQWQSDNSGLIVSHGLALVVVERRLHLLNGKATAPNNVHTTDITLLYDKWYHIAMTYDYLSGRTEIYLNGVERFTKIIPGLSDAVDEDFVYLGSAYINEDQKMSGYLACVMIYSVVLDMDEVTNASAMCEAVMADHIVEVAYWPLNDRFMTKDISGHEYDLTATGVQFNIDRGVSISPEDDLYLLTTPEHPLHFMADMSITFYVYTQTNGGMLQFRNGSDLVSKLGISISNFNGDLTIIKGDVTDQSNLYLVPNLLTTETWHHITLIFDSKTDNVTIILDTVTVWHGIILDFLDSVNLPYMVIGSAILRNQETQSLSWLTGKVACLGLYEGMLGPENITESIKRCTYEPDSEQLPPVLVSWPLNEDTMLMDVSPLSLNLTVEGRVSHSEEGVVLSGEGYLYRDTNTDLVLQEDFSITFWIHAKTEGGVIQWLNKLGSFVVSVGLSLAVDEGGHLEVFQEFPTFPNQIFTIDEVITDKWHHVVLTYDQSSTNITIYIDGHEQWSQGFPAFNPAVSKSLLYIGRTYTSFNDFSGMEGELACVVIYEEALSEIQVNMVHNMCEAIVLDRSALANWPLNDRTLTADLSPNGFNLTAEGSLTFAEEGLVVTIDGDYLLLLDQEAAPSRLRLRGDFTILFWFYPESDGGLFQFLDIFGSIATTVGLSILYIEEKLAIYKTLPENESVAYEVTSQTIIKEKWHHIAMVHKADASNVMLYVDGHMVWDDSIAGLNEATDHGYLLLAAAYFTPTLIARLNGRLTCFMIYDVLLHENEIRKIMRSCESLEIDKHPIADWPLDISSGTADVSGHANNLTSEGIVTHIAEGVELFVEETYSLYWDIPTIFEHRLDHDFTILFWFKPESDGGLFQFANVTGGIASAVGLTLSFITNKLFLFTGFPAYDNNPGVVEEVLANRIWHHVALSYDAYTSNATILIDGKVAWNEMMLQLMEYLDYPTLYLGSHYFDEDTIVGINGILACFKVYARTVPQEEIRSMMHTCDGILLESGAIIDWPLNDEYTVTDVSGYDHNLTSEGTVLHQMEGVLLDQNDDFLLYLNLNDKPDLNLEQDLSILFWVNPQENGGLFQFLNRLGSTVFTVGLTLLYNTQQLLLIDAVGGTPYIVNVALDVNVWHHVGLSYNHLTSNLTVFINGHTIWEREFENLNEVVTNLPFLYLGAAYPIINLLSRFSGHLACFKVYDRILHDRDVERIMQMCHHVELGVATLAYWPLNMEHQTTDLTGNGFNLTNIGVVFNETRGMNMYSDGSEVLYLDTTSGPRLRLLHDFSITFWLLCSVDGGFLQWLDLDQNFQRTAVGLSFSHFGSSLTILEGDAGDSDKVHMINNLFSADVWHHIGLVYDFSRKNATLYLDGEPVWSDVIPNLIQSTDMPYIYIGQVLVVDGISETASRMSGKIACLGIHNGLLTEEGVGRELGRCFRDEEPTVMGFWPINAETLTSDTSGLGYSLVNNGVAFDALGINVETAGSAELFLNLTDGPEFLDGQDLSISLWVYLRSDGGILQWIDRDGQNVEQIGLTLIYIDGALRLYTGSVTGVGNMILLDNTIQLNPWHHIVLSYSALTSNLTVFIDNIQVFEDTVPNLIASTRRKALYFGVAALIDSFTISITGQRLTGSIACLGLYQGAYQAGGIEAQGETCAAFLRVPVLLGYWPLNKVYLDNDIAGNNTLVDEGVDFHTFGVSLNSTNIMYLELNGGSVPAVLKDFTVTFWVKVQEQGGLLQWVSPSQGSGIELGLSLIYFNNILAIYTNSVILNQIENVIVENTWHHLALTYRSDSDNATIYIDGRSVWSQVMPNLENDTYHEFLYIGAAAVSSGNDILTSQIRFTGKMACLAIYDGELGKQEVEEVMYDPRCPLETDPPSVIAFWPLNNETTNSDTSLNGLDLANSGVTFDEVGALLSSSNEVLLLQLTPATLLKPTDFSISFHIRPETQGGILQFANVALSDVENIGLSIALEDGLVVMYTEKYPTTKYISGAFLQLLKWQHFLLTYTNMTNQAIVYIDGVEVWSDTVPDLYLGLQKTVLYLGAAVSGDQLPLQLGWINRKISGKMACLGIYEGVFRAAEIEDLMGECIEPDPIAFWPLNKVVTGNDMSGNQFDLVNQGIVFDQDVGLVLSSSTENQLVLDMRGNVLMLVDDLSLTFWIYPETDGAILEFLNLTNGNSVGFAVRRLSSFLAIYTGSNTIIAANMTNTWQHVAISYDHSRSRLAVYIDGDLVFLTNDTDMTNQIFADFLNVGGIQSDIVAGWASIQGKIACLTLYGQYLTKDDIEDDMEKCRALIYVIPSAYAYWPLNMEYRTSDVSGNGRNLVSTDAVHFDNLIGVRLVNSSTYMLYHENPSVQEDGDMTVLFWIYPVGEEGGILQWLNIEDGKASRIWLSVDYTADELGLFVNDIEFPGDKVNYSGILTSKQWNHVALTYISSSYQLSIYVNGEPKWSGTFTPLSTTVTLSHLFIGTTVWNSNVTFENWHRLDGKLACVGLYNKTLNEAHIKVVMESCDIESDVPLPKAFYPLNSVDRATDTSGNGFDMDSFSVLFEQPAGVYFPGDENFAVYSQIVVGENLILYPDASVTFWIQPKQDGGGILQYLGLNDALTGFDSVGLSILYVKGTMSLYLETTQEPIATYTFTENVIPLNTWSHVTISYEGSSSNAALYVNGTFIQRREIPGLALSTNKTNVFVGVLRLTASNNFKMAFEGSIACLGLYEDALQPEHLPVVMDMCIVDEVQEIPEDIVADIGDCDTNACQSSPCLHGGQCLNENGCDKFSCFCRNNYQGPLCQCPSEFHYKANIESCIKVVTSVKTEVNAGDDYCEKLEQHGHSNLGSVETLAKSNFIKGLIACESNVFRQIATVAQGKGQLDCTELDFFTDISLEKCEENACLVGGNAFHYLTSTQRCLIVFCAEGGLPPYKGGTNYDVYWLMSYNEVRREGTNFMSSPVVISDFPLQAMRAVIIEIMCISNTLTPMVVFSGDEDTVVTFKFNYTENKLELIISNGIQVLDRFASTPYYNTDFEYDGRYNQFWISWVNGEFEIGKGPDVGINGLLSLLDPRYSSSKSYIHTLALTVDVNGLLMGFSAEIHTCPGYWTNGRKRALTSNVFEWAETTDLITYSNWAVPPIGGTLQNCISMGPDGVWVQDYCNVKKCLICEVHLGGHDDE